MRWNLLMTWKNKSCPILCLGIKVINVFSASEKQIQLWQKKANLNTSIINAKRWHKDGGTEFVKKQRKKEGENLLCAIFTALLQTASQSMGIKMGPASHRRREPSKIKCNQALTF